MARGEDAGSRPTDDRDIAMTRPPRPASWHGRAMVATVITGISTISGATLYLLLTNVGGLAAMVALPAMAAVAIPGVAGLVYGVALAHRLRRHRLLADAFGMLPAPRAVLDPALKPLVVNRAFRETFGAGRGRPFDLLGARLVGDPETEAGFVRLREAAMSGGRARMQLALADADGEKRWYTFAIGPADDGSRNLLLRVDDVTALKRSERAARAGRDEFEALVAEAPVGLYVLDEEGAFRFVNRALAEWLGVEAETLVEDGARLRDFLSKGPDDAAPADALGGGAAIGEATLRARDGGHRKALICQRLKRAGNGSGAAAGAVGVVCDVSDFDGLSSARYFEYIFAGAPLGIALLDLEGTVTECNTAFGEISDGPHEGLIGRELTALIVADERDEVAARVTEVAAGRTVDAPLQVHPVAYPDSVFSIYVNRLTEPGGEPSGLMIHSLDVTEQSNLEIQFAQSQKMQAVGQLAGGIAHDFNNLLTAMIGFCDLLLLRHRPGEESFADIMQIKQNANRAANLVRQLLAFSRQQTLEPKVLNVTDILAELTHLLRRLIGENIDLDMIHGRDLGLARVDQGQFEQVIINLVVNARDAMVEGGTLTIRTANVSRDDPVRRGHELMPAGDYVLTEVIDTGEGISKENIGRIFEPFYSTKEIGAGTGLGLSTVYGIVKQTGGFVFVDSVPGQGAKFSIFLPRHDREDASASVPFTRDAEDRRDLTGVGTVLLVEDEDAVRLFGARALRNKGYKVLEAVSGEEALEFIRTGEEHVDLLITDVVMPKMDGPSLIRKVRETRPDLKMICISGYAEDAFRKRLDRSANIHFLPKPFSLQQLAGKVKDVLQSPGP